MYTNSNDLHCSAISKPVPLRSWRRVLLVCALFCVGVGCGGGGGASNGGGGSSPNPVPSLGGLSPNSAVVGSAALTVTASGSNFIPSSVIEWNGTAVSTTYVSATSLTAQIPASDLASAATANVIVQNPAPGGGTSSSISFTVANPSPTVASISPSSALAGNSAFALAVTGTQFVTTSQVPWNGNQIQTAFVSSASLTAQVPASDLAVGGTATITVQNPAPGGGTSTGVSFTINNPSPTISSISPSVEAVGSATFSLAVTGAQFVPTSQVLWNGNQIQTTYVSTTSLTGQIPASDLSSVGTASIVVQSPSPGGGTSSSLTFTVNPLNTTLSSLNLEGTDLVWDPTQKKFYVAVPAGASVNPSTITVVDPIAGAIVSAQQLSSAASGLAISDDSQYLYAVTNGGSTIQRFTLPALAPDIQWSLGTDPMSGAQSLAGDIKVQPGASHTLAVSMGQFGSGLVAVFDDGVKRSAVAGGVLSRVGNSLQWKPDGTGLYAAYTEGNDSPFFTTVSDDALYTMTVNSNGVGAITTYDSSFREEGAHLHSDPSTGYVYGDWGEVVNASTGIPVGNYRWSRPLVDFFPGPLSVVDPTLKRFYTLLEVTEPDGTRAFQIQSFDQTQFRLLSTIVIPGSVDGPTNFIRWGQAGLAFVTNGSSSSPGNLYIVDGGFVNPSAVQDTSAGTPLNPLAALTAINPTTTTVGSGPLTLVATGHDFSGQTTLYWNGNALPTTILDSTDLSAQVPASDLVSVSQATITASNGTPIPTSNPLPFSINTAPPAGNHLSVYSTGGNDLVWDAAASKLYVSMPGVQGDAGDAIAIVDPVTGTVTSSGFIGSDPARLSLSTDSQYLYVALYGENAIKQLTLPDFSTNNAWNLGRPSNFDGPYYALDLQVAPGAPQTTAITLANFDISPSAAAVVIYDGSVQRPTPLPSGRYTYSGLKWADNATLYAVDQSAPTLLVLGVGSSGAVLDQHYDNILSNYSPGINYDAGTGLVYTDTGQAVQPSNGTIAGNYGASGLVVPDSTLDRVFILGQTSAQTGTSNYTIESFDQRSFIAVGSIIIQNVVGTPTSFIRWGSDGLAFTTRVGNPASFAGAGPGQLYVISGNFVNPSATPSQSPSLQPAVQRTWDLKSKS
jgi:hypothetical protein